jgi:valyl-tRNA synthetase
MGNIDAFSYVDKQVEGALSFRVKSNEYFIPIAGSIDVEAEIEKLEEELKYNEGFLKSVEKKLSNERFVNNAPEKVVAIEKAKKADAEAKIEAIKASLKSLK